MLRFPVTASDTERKIPLVISIFIAGLCSIIYELLIGTVSSYFLGNSVTQFSLTIGVYMAALGVGAWLSRLVKTSLPVFFVKLEILLGFLGGISVPCLFFCYSVAPQIYIFVMVLFTFSIGVLIGYEIPLLTRLLESFYDLKVNISKVLSMDYLGALIATLLFPFVLLPLIGPFRSSLVVGLINMLIGFLILRSFYEHFEDSARRRYVRISFGVVGLLSCGLLFSQTLIHTWSQSLYDDYIIVEEQTAYQRMVLTSREGDFRLFLDGNLQFSSKDEYRYHEALAFPVASAAERAQKLLVLGGGDGLLVKQLLRLGKHVEITLVDLDPAVTRLARENPLLAGLNENALLSDQVQIIHDDAFRFLSETQETWDVIYADLPDPNNLELTRLYSQEFFNLVHSRLNWNGYFVTQATSPYYANTTYWQIVQTLEDSRFSHLLPYHVNVPSFGEWGFVIAGNQTICHDPQRFPEKLKFMNASTWKRMQIFPPDITCPDVELESNTLNHPVLLGSYLKSVKDWR